ncbi:MAG: hypothetical protein Q9185_001294 [Variospora sp. 1 TL-2023]
MEFSSMGREYGALQLKAKFPIEMHIVDYYSPVKDCLKKTTSADLVSVLLNVYDEAIARQKETDQKQWKVKKRGKDGEDVRLREVYGAIASCAMRFQTAVAYLKDKEHPLSPLLSPLQSRGKYYDSIPGAAEGAAKSKRPFRSIDPTSQAAARGLLDTISRTRANVDANANHAYATKNMGILGELGKTQDHIFNHLESNGFDREERYRRLSAILAEVHDPLYSIEDKVSSLYDHMAKTQQRAEITSIVDWLSPAADEGRRKTYHKSLSSPKHRLPASGRRLLDHPGYLKWEKSKTSSIRCISGVEGTGKTLLFSVTIDHLQTLITNNGDPERLAFFYTSAQGGSLLTNQDDIIRSTTRQPSTTQAGTIQPTGKETKIFLVAGYYGSALLAACYAGNEMTVEFLLAGCNADFNSQGGYSSRQPSNYGTFALKVVWTRSSYRKVFDLLLSFALQQCDHDRDKLTSFTNRPSSAGKTALIDAAERDWPEMTKMMLKPPFNAN